MFNHLRLPRAPCTGMSSMCSSNNRHRPRNSMPVAASGTPIREVLEATHCGAKELRAQESWSMQTALIPVSSTRCSRQRVNAALIASRRMHTKELRALSAHLCDKRARAARATFDLRRRPKRTLLGSFHRRIEASKTCRFIQGASIRFVTNIALLGPFLTADIGN